MAKKNITFNDIASYTGFSKTTISRYFNRPESITEEHRKIIQDALEALNYRENKVARILANGTTEFIGIILPNFYNAYYQDILSNILSTFETFGYKYIVFSSDGNADTERKYIQELLAYKVEGLLMFSHTLPSEELAELPIPVVGIEREDQYISSVNCDNYTGSIMAMKLLKSHSCSVFVHINTPTLKSTPSFSRITGFMDYCIENGLNYEVMIKNMGVHRENVKAQMTSILDSLETIYPEEKIGMFFSNDTDANEFLKLLIRKYHTLPDRYRIVGFDGSRLAQAAIYSITSIGQNIDSITQRALHILSEQIKSQKETGTKPGIEHQVIAPQLVLGETTEYYNN